MASLSCVIGENNSGKSSLMQAIKLFLKPTKLNESDYYDKTRPVIITLSMHVSENDLGAITDEEHRRRITEVVRDQILILTQSFPFNEKSQMTCTRRVPKEERWLDSRVSEAIKGKSGAVLKQAALEQYPEIESALNAIEGSLTQTKIKEVISAHLTTLGPEQWKDDDFAPLPTGLDASVKNLFPEPIYIEAVKDIAEDVKTTKEAVFGKLLGLLLNVIQAEKEMQDFRETLKELNTRLNITTKQDGTKEDKRFKQVVALERTIEANLREHFPDATVSIQIPPPDLQKILQSAQIDVHDGGVMGNVETKGDGLKRSVMFSLFRAFAQLSKPENWADQVMELPDIAHRHIILFEEPELYLHPKAQQVLFESLIEVSKSFQVIVTTHSPLFFSARKTKAFAKLMKGSSENGVPFSDLISVDLEKELSIKDEFQMLCYENNNVAFFSNKVLLVEGDSDVAALKHLSSILTPAWDFDKGKVRMVKVGGKGNFARYIDFFKRFKIDVMVLADLDILIAEFDKLGLQKDSPCIQARANLLNKVSKMVSGTTLNQDNIKETWKDRGNRIIQIIANVVGDVKPTSDDLAFLNTIQDEFGQKQEKLSLLRNEQTLQQDKLMLLRDLRAEGVMVLARGTLEDYYPDFIQGSDKILKAADFRNKVNTRQEALALASDVPISDGRTANELETIFSRIFDDKDIKEQAVKEECSKKQEYAAK